MEIELIEPKIKESYSEAIYTWARRHFKVNEIGIYEEVHDTIYSVDLYSKLYFGLYKQSDYSNADFFGNKLDDIITRSGRNIFTIEKIKLKRRLDIEELYLKIGRCAFDLEHKFSNLGSRWQIDTFNMIRTCRFCGYSQRQEWKNIITTKKVEIWEETKQLVLPFKEIEIIL